jgi:hypothetical protein
MPAIRCKEGGLGVLLCADKGCRQEAVGICKETGYFLNNICLVIIAIDISVDFLVERSILALVFRLRLLRHDNGSGRLVLTRTEER